MANIQISKPEYARLVAIEAHLKTLLQCRYKPVEQLQAVLHSIADTVESETKEKTDA